MMRTQALVPKFSEFIPKNIEDGILYVSLPYGTAVHRCCCGCGNEVVTPLSPADWKIRIDGEYVSLDPSIGNWHLACKSHYWIRHNKIVWAAQWNEHQIRAGRIRDQAAKKRYYDKAVTPASSGDSTNQVHGADVPRSVGIWAWIKSWFS
ncbi:DUF6527 family protein [Noviherbaspirillum saxi]|uniref:DUF6527 family protein n=1 Tax=Noviherbaspirillum saxi TaxID=2320863 RepID=UPI0018F3DC25|nr:DUF6527 family protein [Noviherbaspirillum saxi]